MSSANNKLSEIVARLAEVDVILDTNLADVPEKNRAAYEGLQNQARQEGQTLQSALKSEIAANIEAVLISGPGEADAVKALDGLKVITVDAQQLYIDLDNVVSPLSGTVRLDETAFMRLVPMINNLHALTGRRQSEQLVFEEIPTQETLAASFSQLVRNQLGGAGAEPLASLYIAVQKAFDSRVTVAPIPVVIYNLRNATEQQYLQTLSSVRSFFVETGSKKEVLSILKKVKDQLVKEGKIETQSQETSPESNDSQQKERE